MRVSEEQKGNAIARSVEAKAKAKLPPPNVDWDVQIDRLKKTLTEMYRR